MSRGLGSKGRRRVGKTLILLDFDDAVAYVPAAVRLAMEVDKDYFETHPNVSKYTRSALPGEGGQYRVPATAAVEVHDVGEGCRVRVVRP